MKKRVLIAGATGFIGRNLAEYFSRLSEYEVIGTHFRREAPDIPNVKMIRADLTKAEDVARAMEGVHILIQAAATTSGAKDITTKPYIHVTDNAVMNALLFREAFERKLEKVVFFSCTVMYQSSAQPIKETDYSEADEVHPKYFGVGWTKVYNEKMCEFFSRISNTKYLVVRHSNVYGPHDKYDLEKSHVFGATITKVLTNSDGRMVVWGEGKEVRDFIHVNDLVKFVHLALAKEQKPYALYNVGGGESVTVGDLVRKIVRLSGKEIELEFDKTKPSIDTKVQLDISKVKNELGWSPEINLENGIQQTITWYRQNVLRSERG